MTRLKVGGRNRRPYKPNNGHLKKHLLSKTDECGICGHQLDEDDATIDHVIPLSRGGSNTVGNMQLAHEACNKAKGNHLPSEYELEPLPLVWIKGVPFVIKPEYVDLKGLYWIRQGIVKMLCTQRTGWPLKKPNEYSATNINIVTLRKQGWRPELSSLGGVSSDLETKF